MGVFSRTYPEGHPNAKMYELAYEDGERYTFRQGGRQPVRQWNLAAAISMADHVTSQDLEVLSVIDPVTGAVIWAGEVITR